MKYPLYNQQGEKMEKVNIPENIFGLNFNHDLVHQAVVAQMANKRQSIAHAKTRAEVRGGGKKPWRQKGTGRARHGSIRSPLWKGGGVTFGPSKEKKFAKKINKKIKRKALFMVLSSKVKDSQMILLDKLELNEAKTKKMAEILNNLKFQTPKQRFQTPKQSKLATGQATQKSKPKKQSILIVLPSSDKKIIRAAKNIPKTKTIRADSLNVLDLLNYKYLLMPQEAVEVIEKTYLNLTQKSKLKSQNYSSKLKTF